MIEEILLFAAIAFAAMLVQSFVGFGGPLVAVPLLTLFFPPREALPSLSLMFLMMNILLVLEVRTHIDWRRIGMLFLGAIAGVPLGILALQVLPVSQARLAINAMVLLFAVLLWRNARLPVPDNRRVRVLVGAVSGFLSGWAGTAGPPMAVFGLAHKWPKDTFRGTLLAFFTGLTIVTLGGYAVAGLVDGRTFIQGSAALAGALPAGWIGVMLTKRASQVQFRRFVLAAITLVAVAGLVVQLTSGAASPAER